MVAGKVTTAKTPALCTDGIERQHRHTLRQWRWGDRQWHLQERQRAKQLSRCDTIEKLMMGISYSTILWEKSNA